MFHLFVLVDWLSSSFFGQKWTKESGLKGSDFGLMRWLGYVPDRKQAFRLSGIENQGTLRLRLKTAMADDDSI